MVSVLITGSNRGIGLSLVKYLLNHEDPPKILIAACRNPDAATELKELQKKNSGLHILQLDITQYDTFPNFAKKVESIVGPAGLNVLINNAAITVDNNNHLDNVKPDDFIRVYKNNVVGPIFLTKALLPLIERAADVNKDKPQGIKRAAIFNMSSLGGSVSLNSRMGGSCYCYRESKAALNQFSRTLALVVEDKEIVLVVLHPGHVQTDMGGPTARITVDESVSGLVKVIYSADKNMHNKFVMWNGGELTW